ncbi:glycosyltransferase [Luteimonas terricola]|uniref:glycosyltransferase n=1 Tax=Luteimonas terricola TaxID=645597 RepID=UPI0014046D4D|nr:glycosyltransferase [Luteimonas terricola]
MIGIREDTCLPLRILLVAYEFPPSPSPQSLRWAYLSGRLAELGHEVHVMAPDIGGSGRGLPELGPGVRVHRLAPGPVRGLLARLERRRPLGQDSGEGSAGSAPDAGIDDAEDAFAHAGPVEPPRLNWKGQLLKRFQDGVSWLLFPDLRGEWARPALRALPGIVDLVRPDVVVTSHEPATTLQLGLAAKAGGACWVADLGDPVLAAYTPRRWRRRAAGLERRVLREADHVMVTTAGTRDLLRQRHGGEVPITVVSQGFDDLSAAPPQQGAPSGGVSPFELVYSGSFYAFRDPRALIEGVLQVDGVRLNIASGNVPDWLPALSAGQPGRLRLLGRVPHRRLLELQRRAGVLVNIANADPAQIPGKVYEYFGACRPVLHLQAEQGDAVSGLLGELRRGVACAGDAEAVSSTVSKLAGLARAGMLDQGFDLGLAPVAGWGWTALAERVERVLLEAAGRASKVKAGAGAGATITGSILGIRRHNDG